MRRTGTALVLLCLATSVGCSRTGMPVEPKTIAVQEIPRLIRSLPGYAHFGYSGVSFFKGRLYASTNIGLLAVAGGKAEALYQWQERDSVVEGPWSDIANDAIWIQHASDGSLARYDGARWRRVELPPPPRGFYTRGDMMTGFIGISAPQDFWLVGGGNAWRWGAKGDWAAEPQPPAPDWSAVRAVAPLGDTLLYIVREGIGPVPTSPYALYDRQRNWHRSPLKSMDFEQVVVTAEAVYVLAEDGTLFSLSAGSITLVPTPGSCEAITRTSTGGLLASFKNQGIYLFAGGGWEIKAPYPYDSTEGEHWAHLAENGGQVAYATRSMLQLLGADGKRTYSGTAALWVLDGATLQRVVFE